MLNRRSHLMLLQFFLACGLALSLLAAMPISLALADCVELPPDTWTCTGADADGMDATTNAAVDIITVNAGATIDNPVVAGSAIQMTDGTATNGGTITANTDSATGIFSGSSANITNTVSVTANGLSGTGVLTINGNTTNSGTITANGDTGTAIFTDTGNVVNSGTLSTTGNNGTGISASSGNNVITNTGTILATGTLGVGILAGTGNDTIGVGAGSTTSGNVTAIDAGDNDDTVNIGNGATVNGNIDGGNGTDTLNFAGISPSQLVGKNPAGDSITVGGKTYTWLNFETLVGLSSNPSSSSVPDANFNGSVTVTNGDAYYINSFFGQVHVEEYGKHYTGAVKITSNGITVCMEVPAGYEAIGPLCYTDKDGGRKDFYIRLRTTPSASTTSIGIPVGASGGVFQCGAFTLNIPAGVLPNGSLLKCGLFSGGIPAAPNGFTFFGRVIDIVITDSAGKNLTTFSSPLKLCTPFTTAEALGVGGANNFVIVTANIGGTWQEVVTKIEGNQVCGTTDHLTLFEFASRASSASLSNTTVATATTLPTIIPSTGDMTTPWWVFGIVTLLGVLTGAAWLVIRRKKN